LVFQLLIVFILLRNVYYIATRFSTIPFGDPYWDFGVLETFATTGHSTVIQAGAGLSELLTWYSAYPLLELLSVMLSAVSTVEAFQIVLILPTLINTATLAFVYLLVENLRKAMHLSDFVTIFALLLYCTSADTLFWPMRFTHQNLGILLLTILLYYLSKFPPSTAWTGARTVILLTLIPITVAHHFTSFIVASYLFLLSIIQVLAKRLAAKWNFFAGFSWSNARPQSLLNISVIITVLILAWATHIATVILPTAASIVEQLRAVIAGLRSLEPFVPEAYYPTSLTPSWALPVLTLRDAFLFGPAILGLFMILRRRPQNPQMSFVSGSLIITGFLFTLNLMALWVEPYRLVTLFAPLLCFSAAIFYDRARNALSDNRILSKPLSLPRRLLRFKPSARSYPNVHNRALRRRNVAGSIFLGTIIVFLVCSSFVGLWGHRYVPEHLYDPSVSMIEVGEHKMDYVRLKTFTDVHLPYQNIDRVLADDILPLYVILPPAQYLKIYRLSIGNVTQKSVVLQLRDLNLYEYYYSGSPPIEPSQITEQQQILRSYLQSNLNCVYSDGEFNTWQ
jgi:hypothetical protein